MAALVLQGQTTTDGQAVEDDGEWEEGEDDDSKEEDGHEGEEQGADSGEITEKPTLITRTVRFGDKGWGKIVTVKCG